MSLLSKLLFSVTVICCLFGIAHADTSVIALTGHAVPGVAGATFSSFSQASVNNSGEIAFQAGLSNGGTGIFKLSHCQLSAVALSGQEIEDSSGLTFGEMGFPVINDSSTIAFIASIQGGVPKLQAVFVASGTSVNKVFDTTTTIPGTDQITGGISGPLQLNSKGDIAILAYIGTTGSPSVLVISNGVILSVISDAWSFSLNNRGDIAFADGSHLYLYSGGETQLIAQTGQSVSNSNSPLGTIDTPAMNDQEGILFITGGSLSPFGGLQPNTLIKWSAGILEQIVSFGDPIPGVSNGGLFHIYGPLVDNSGRVFFASQFYNNNNLVYGLFMYDNGNISLLVQDSQVLQGVGTFTAISYPDVNDSGIVTFESSLDNGSSGVFQLNAFFKLFFRCGRVPVFRMVRGQGTL